MKKRLFIKNNRGLRIATIMETPGVKHKHPVVIMFHGFKGYKEEATYSELAKELLKNNIGSVRFDATGFGESDGNLAHDYRFTNYISDTEIVYKWLLRNNIGDKSRIAVFGQSMGAMMAIVFSVGHPEIKTVVSVSPADVFATRDDFGKKVKKWRKDKYLEIKTSKKGLIKVPFDFVSDIQKYNISEIVKKVKQPKLFILGLEDVTVIPDQTRDVYKGANDPKKLIEIPGMDHFYKNDAQILKKVNSLVTDFFVEYL